MEKVKSTIKKIRKQPNVKETVINAPKGYKMKVIHPTKEQREKYDNTFIMD